MKKHNDGYVLPFVLVVLVVVSFVAVSLMSSALTNLQRQQASVQRMEDKYGALGEIEKSVAEWDAKVNQTYTRGFPEGTADSEKTTEYAAQLVLKEIFGTNVTVSFNGEPAKFEHEERDSLGESIVKADVTVSVTIAQADVILVSEAETVVGYKVTVNGEVTYDTYTISHEEVTP